MLQEPACRFVGLHESLLNSSQCFFEVRWCDAHDGDVSPSGSSADSLLQEISGRQRIKGAPFPGSSLAVLRMRWGQGGVSGSPTGSGTVRTEKVFLRRKRGLSKPWGRLCR